MYYYNNFLFFSIIGFLFENLICIIFNSTMESGIMYGPFTPVYGIGILIILFIYNNLNYKKEYKKGIMLFIFSFIVLTIIEYLGGILIEIIFKDIFWDYSRLPLHIGKYISLEVSIVWSIGSVIYIYLIKPLTDKIVLLTPIYITYILTFIFILDFTLTIINKQKII